jgi:hypothetical protein
MFEGIGEHAGWYHCYHGFSLLPVFRCGGYPDSDPFESSNAASIGRWMQKKQDSDWMTPTDTVERDTESGTGKVKFNLRAMDGVNRMQLKKLNQRGMVMARIDADPESPDAEKRYKIGGEYTNKMNLSNEFFLVVKPYKVVIDPVGDTLSRQISEWQIFGADKTDGHLVPLRKSRGKFRYCAYAHEGNDRHDGSYFQSCKTQRNMMRIEHKGPIRSALGERRSLLSVLYAHRRDHPVAGGITVENFRTWFQSWLNQKSPGTKAEFTDADVNDMVVALDEVSSAMVWVTCGPGCCTADEM